MSVRGGRLNLLGRLTARTRPSQFTLSRNKSFLSYEHSSLGGQALTTCD